MKRFVLVGAALAALAVSSTAAEARRAAQAPQITQFCGDRYGACPGMAVSAREPRGLRSSANPYRRGDEARAPHRRQAAAGPAVVPAIAGVPLPRARPADLAAVAANDGHDDELSRARAYLVLTSTPGFTMSILGPDYAVSQLHPVFVTRAAAAIAEARAAGLDGVGLYSSFRPARFGVGGFGDKLNSLHAYGLAGDFTGIGRAGSRASATWYRIAIKNGLYNPYGPRHGSEFNHYQATRVTIVLRGSALRRTVDAKGPLDLERMWKVGAALIDAGPDRRRPTLTAARRQVRYAVAR